MYKIIVEKLVKEDADRYEKRTEVFTHTVESIDLPNLIVEILNNTTQLEGLGSDDTISVPDTTEGSDVIDITDLFGDLLNCNCPSCRNKREHNRATK